MPAPGSALTYQANRQQPRHGWLHLTPAYAADLVDAILDQVPPGAQIFDPFAGSGTTLIRAAERGFASSGWDINPFLCDVIRAKSLVLSAEQARAALTRAEALTARAVDYNGDLLAQPAMHNIERWWSQTHRLQLRQLKTLVWQEDDSAASLLQRLAFAACVKAAARVDHRHHSLSFSDSDSNCAIFDYFLNSIRSMLDDCQQPLPQQPSITLHDARRPLPEAQYDVLITSPPYPNRMSYMRELRPYLYWLDYMEAAHAVADLDWQAIGGSWGTATNRLQHWSPASSDHAVPALIRCLAQLPSRGSSELITRYLIRYSYDILAHLQSMRQCLHPGARLHYIIGNASYYGSGFDSDALFCELLAVSGYSEIDCRQLRRRSSSRRLYEYEVSARLP